jgi:uncharacterized delta-60 repeat protein
MIVNRKDIYRILAAAAIAALCISATALAADQSDPSFGQGGVAISPQPQKAALAEAGIWDLATAPEGRMAAALGGQGQTGYFGAVRLNEDGSPDRSFGSEGFTVDYEVPPLTQEVFPGSKFNDEQKTQAQAVAVGPDGKVLVAGYLEVRHFNNNQSYAPVLIRYRPDGRPDPSFGEAGVVAPAAVNQLPAARVLHAVAVAPSGRIIGVGAESESADGEHRRALVLAYTPEGHLDRSFGHGGQIAFRIPPFPRSRGHAGDGSSNTFTAVQVLPSGKILLAGYLLGRLSLARLLPNGRHDKSFGDGDGKVSLEIGRPYFCCAEWASMAVQSDGRILLAGVLERHDIFHLALARFRPNGTLDPSFGKGGLLEERAALRMHRPRDLAVQEDGRIIVTGIGKPGLGLSFRTMRLLPDGTPDQSFGSGGLQLLNPGVDSAAYAALTQGNGRVVTAGSLLLQNGDHHETQLLLARYLASAGQ